MCSYRQHTTIVLIVVPAISADVDVHLYERSSSTPPPPPPDEYRHLDSPTVPSNPFLRTASLHRVAVCPEGLLLNARGQFSPSISLVAPKLGNCAHLKSSPRCGPKRASTPRTGPAVDQPERLVGKWLIGLSYHGQSPPAGSGGGACRPWNRRGDTLLQPTLVDQIVHSFKQHLPPGLALPPLIFQFGKRWLAHTSLTPNRHRLVQPCYTTLPQTC